MGIMKIDKKKRQISAR